MGFETTLGPGFSSVLAFSFAGPLLITSHGHEEEAIAAMPLLRAIGAWRTTKPDQGAESSLTELQAHLALGGLLGYHSMELHGLHKTWAPTPPRGSRSGGQVESTTAVDSTFHADLEAAMTAVPRHVECRISAELR